MFESLVHIYRQIDGIVVSIPLGPVYPNFFLRVHMKEDDSINAQLNLFFIGTK